MREQLEVIWTTSPYTPHAIAAHPRVEEAVRAALTEAFLAMNNSPDSLALLKQLNFKGFELAANGDWDDVRGLGIASLTRPVGD